MLYSNYNLEIQVNDKIVLFNAVTNSYAIFLLEEFERMKKCPSAYLGSIQGTSAYSQFLNEGFFIRDEAQEWSLIKDNFYTKAYNSSVFNATIIPTNSCNLACSYCFAPRSSITMSNEVIDMTIAYFEKVLSANEHNLKHFNVKWFGGEPLLHPRAINAIGLKLIEFCEVIESHYHASIYTNLTILNDEIIRVLREGGITEIFTTLDGVGNVNDSRRPAKDGRRYFSRLVENIKRVSEISPVNILTNIDASNKESVENLIDFLVREDVVDGERIKIGFNLINDNEFILDKDKLLSYESNETVEMIDGYVERLRDRASYALPADTISCLALAKNTIVVDPDGGLRKCPLGKQVGSVFDSSLFTYNDSVLTGFDDIFTKSDCVSCKVFPLCYGGCSHEGQTICIMKKLITTKIKRYFQNYLSMERC